MLAIACSMHSIGRGVAVLSPSQRHLALRRKLLSRVPVLALALADALQDGAVNGKWSHRLSGR